MADRDDIKDTLSKVREILSRVVGARDIIFPKIYRDPLKDAWSDLMGPGPYTIDEMMNAIFNLSDDDLNKCGLSGNHLKFKREGFLESYGDLDREGGIKRLKRFLKWAKFILGSLSKIIPLVEILKEFVEAVERGVERAEEG